MTSEIDRPNADDAREAELDRRLASLTRSAEPAPSSWSRIQQRIEQDSTSDGRHRHRPIWPVAMAAAAVFALVAVVVWQLPTSTGPQFDDGRQLVQREAEAMRRAAPMVTGGFEEAPPLAEAWTENQIAIDELEAALDRDPDNRLLLEFLAEARLRQVRMLNSGLATFPRTDV